MSSFPSEISQLSPTLLWQFFDKICSIPHPSTHEEALAQYIVDWATGLNLTVRRDPTGSIFIKKPATAGMENRKGVILQAHLDMVPQKNEETVHDFLTDAIQPYIDGEWVTAKGTTLGADNGIGVASCLAVLASTDIKHGPLEVFLTVDEESSMAGAFGLQAGWLDGDILINTDSEQEGEVYMGCAGGCDALLTFTMKQQAIPSNFVTHKLTIKGLKGGHSGCDIHTGRGNANKLMARFLANYAQPLDLRLIDFNGGNLANAIPREAFATVAIAADKVEQLAKAVDDYLLTIKQELGKVEDTLSILNQTIDSTSSSFSTQDQQRFIATLNASPNGVIRMSDEIKGVVETSLNMGVIQTDGNKITVLCLLRSLIDSGREQVGSMLNSIAQLADAEIEFSGAYPGWKPDANSEIMHVFRNMYQDLYGEKPNIMVIHAGLECGLFKEPYPHMDMLSFGPTIKFPHSPDEKVQINSVERYWQQMIALLAAIPEK